MKIKSIPDRAPGTAPAITIAAIVAVGLLALTPGAQAQRGGDNRQPQRGGGGAPQRGGGGGTVPQRTPPQAPVQHARREAVTADRTPTFSPRQPTAPTVQPGRPLFPQQNPRPGDGFRQPNGGGQQGGGNGRPAGSGFQRPVGGQAGGQPQQPVIRGSGRPGGRPNIPVTNAVVHQRTFTKTPQGRRYDNGVQLRHGIKVSQGWQQRYFKHGTYHYPYYYPTYSAANVFISPFGFYFGVCAPFLERTHCHVAPPDAVYVDIPIYQGSVCVGYPAISDSDNFLDQDYLWSREPGLSSAVDELEEGFGQGNIDALVSLIDPNIDIAVYLRGKYRYSLPSNDFVDLTRDGLKSIQTISFNITRIHERAAGVYVVSGEHLYQGEDGATRKVYVSYVLEDVNGEWTLTQVGDAPDRVQSWQ